MPGGHVYGPDQLVVVGMSWAVSPVLVWCGYNRACAKLIMC